ncbi:PAS domain-containing hybrid sensor histidine kinase/response regulator [Parabacteroides pacaensis]|uniref:PAS domain-containing hybrid sensor histidine kinase/response regulator n=1 Tax=Parabacteroides pacaensis TaxID=2086575 RepID=UPI001F2EC121|nr:PAS domain-containing hybrid sensor histidine kinase/response regulator [Parabacteroides pacaensis]
MNTYENFTKSQLIDRIKELEMQQNIPQNEERDVLNDMESFAVSTDEIYSFDLSGHLIYANQLAIDHYQLKKPYQPYTIWGITEDIAETDWPDFVNNIQTKKMVRLQTIHTFFSGEKVPFEVSAYWVKDWKYGEMIVCFAHDISESLSNLRKTNFLNLLMNTILSNIFVIIGVKELFDNFKYIYFNKAAEEFMGLDANKVIGNSDFEIFPDPRRAHEIRTEDYSTIKNGRTEKAMVEYEKPNGEVRIVNMTRLLIKNPDEGASPLLLVMLWDITEQRQNELDLLKAQEADKMKNAFIANMSHEIRTPLNALVGFSCLLAETENANERQEYLSIINKNSDLLLQLINDILDFSKIESGTLDYHISEVELKNICQAVYVTQSLKMTTDVALLFNAESLPSVRLYTDAQRLEQVLLNLLTNAIKCTTQGFVMLSYEVEEEFVRVSVTDTGSGIPREKQQSIFNRFVKLDNFKQGTGLGLAICKMIIEKLGGEIGVKSQVGMGSTFWFTLPLQEQETTAILKEKDTSSPIVPEDALPGQYTVLIAEDVLENYLLLQAILKKQYRLLHAINGQKAVELYHQYQPDLILMDIKMPVMNGFEAVAEIRKVSKEIPIIALTAFAYETEKKEAMNADFTDYLVKPVDIPLLKQKLKYYLNN